MIKENIFFEDERGVLQKSLYNMEHKQPMTTTIQRIEIRDLQEKTGFMNYRIFTISSGFATKYVDTMRRYSEFEKLHLEKFVILPKFPGKHGIQDMIQFDENSKQQFINSRKEDLQIYLNLLIANEKMKQDPILKQFLSQSSLQKLTKQIQKSNISLPSTAPQKIVHTLKQTIQGVYKIFQNWNVPTIEIELSLKSKITKIQQIKLTMTQLLSIQLQRLKCIKIKQKQLYNLKNGINTNLLKTITDNIKQKLLPQTITQQTSTVDCLQCVQKIYSYMDMRFKEQKINIDKMQNIKKKIKLMIAKCDSVLGSFQELATEKSEPQITKNSLSILDTLIQEDKYVKAAKDTLKQYEQYYKIINKMQSSGYDKLKVNKLQDIKQNDDFDEQAE